MEFGFIALPFFGLLAAIIQTSLLFFVQQTLDTATQMAARQIMTGQARAANMTQAQFRNFVCGKLPNFAKCSWLILEVKPILTMADARTPPPTITWSGGNPTATQPYNIGNAGDLVMVRASYPWGLFGGGFGLNFGNLPKTNGYSLLVAASITRSEQF